MTIINKRVNFEYFLYDKFEAGIVLLGAEVKSIRHNNADLTNSHARFLGKELFLINANVPVEGKKDYNPTRPRKLLLHRSQLTSILAKLKAKKLTLVPTKMYNKGSLIKVELALAKHKRKFEKRADSKAEDLKREIEVELKAREAKNYL